MKDTTTFEAFGPGKVILLGEHGVVYGRGALAAPLSRGVRAHAVPARSCTLKLPALLQGPARRLLTRAFERAADATGRPKVAVTVESDLPISMGLGSSAALSVACAKLLLQAAGGSTHVKQVVAVALEMEREFHGTPSGLDHTTSAQAELIYFRRKPSGVGATFRGVPSPRPLKLLIALVGKRAPTHQTVASLKARLELWPQRYGRSFDEMGRLADEGARAISSGDFDALGDMMNLNHGLLSGLQLSSPSIDEMVHKLRRMGALGAKLTGAGGDGGAVIGLFLEPEPTVARLTRDGVTCFSSQISGPAAL